MNAQPVVVAFDGSEPAHAAVSTAATLWPGRRLVIVSVWEPGLAVAMAPLRDPTGIGTMPPSTEETEAIDRLQSDHAASATAVGVRIAEDLGATAEAMPIADEGNVAATIADIAERVDACAVVIGSRGLGGLKSRLFGSTSRAVLQRTHRPVLVVKAPGEARGS